MKIRSFTISLLVSILFSMNMISCNATPVPPTQTSIPTVTATSTPAVPTKIPTETPPQLPNEVKDKFDKAGIDLNQMQNATFDNDGLHITLESGEVVNFTNEEMKKIVFIGQGNVLQLKDEENEKVLFVFNKEIGLWEGEAVYNTRADFTKYEFSMDGLQLNEDGSIIDPTTGIEVYKDGKFELHFIVDNLQTETLEKTNIKPINGDRNNASSEVDTYNAETYTNNVYFIEELISFNEGDEITLTSILIYEYPNDNSFAWGFSLNFRQPNETINTAKYLVFVDNNGQLVTYPILPISPEDVANYYAS